LSIERLRLEDPHLICATWDDIAYAIEEVSQAEDANRIDRKLLLQFAQYVRRF